MSDTKTQWEAFREFVDRHIEAGCDPRIREMEAERDKLREEVSRWKVEFDKQCNFDVSCIQALKKEISELKKNYAVACELIGKTQDERDAAKNQADTMLAERDAAFAAHLSERESLQKRVDELNTENDELTHCVDRYREKAKSEIQKQKTLEGNLSLVTAERDKFRKQVTDINLHHRDLFEQWIGGMASVLRTSRAMYLAEMADSVRRDMCGVDPSTVDSHRAKEEFLQACQRMFGRVGEQ